MSKALNFQVYKCNYLCAGFWQINSTTSGSWDISMIAVFIQDSIMRLTLWTRLLYAFNAVYKALRRSPDLFSAVVRPHHGGREDSIVCFSRQRSCRIHRIELFYVWWYVHDFLRFLSSTFLFELCFPHKADASTLHTVIYQFKYLV